jgi:hypothetical protein
MFSSFWYRRGDDLERPGLRALRNARRELTANETHPPMLTESRVATRLSLAVLGVLLAAYGCSDRSGNAGLPVRNLAAQSGRSATRMPIQHVVIVIQENRSFDKSGRKGAISDLCDERQTLRVLYRPHSLATHLGLGRRAAETVGLTLLF